MFVFRISCLALVFLINPLDVKAWNQLVPPPSKGPSKTVDRPVWLTSAAKVTLTTFAAVSLAMPVHAADIAQGKTLFQAQCAGCHIGGQNVVSEKKTLKKEAIEKYRKTTEPAKIQDFVQNGMPHKMLPLKFSEDDYSDVVAYVMDQALNDKW